MNITVIYDSVTGTTKEMAEYIVNGLTSVSDVTAKSFKYNEIDNDFVKDCTGFIVGTPTYAAGPTSAIYTFMEKEFKMLGVAGKLGGAFATENYVHGGADLAISRLLEHMMVYGMMVYSGGGSFGPPIIHFGPVALNATKKEFKENFITYGKRFAEQAKKVFK